MDLFTINCPTCQSRNFKRHAGYETKHNGRKDIYCCIDCKRYFSSSTHTFLAGIRKSVSLIVTVLKARTEGLGLNAACRAFDLAKNTLLNWERRFSEIKKTLLLYALLHSYLQLIIEGDEVYTRVAKNVPPDQSRFDRSAHGQGQSLSVGTRVRQERL